MKNSTEHVNDLGLYFTKAQSLSDDRKLELLKNSWTPTRAYNFPKTQFYGKNRAFSFEWLTQFPWLVYSAAQDGAFCRFCVLFGHLTGKNSDRLDKLYKSPLKNWVSASTKFKEHQLNSEFHKAAAGCTEDFLRVQEGKMLDKPDFILTTDASKIGWGAVCCDHKTGGCWDLDEQQYHINYLESKAVLLGLKSLCSGTQNKHIRIQSDNTTHLNATGGIKSLNCNDMAIQIWEWWDIVSVYSF